MEIDSLRIAKEKKEADFPVQDLDLLGWLLEGDPAIRWQTLRDLTDAEPQEVESERARVAETGWGARLLGLQEPSGMWGGGLYSPKWISTAYTLLELHDLGLPHGNPQAISGCRLLIERGFFRDGGINFSTQAKYSETCITGLVLNICAYFRLPDERLKAIVEHLLRQQLPDGGWNCRSFKGDTHSSFHTTMMVLEGLEQFRRRLIDHSEFGTLNGEVATAQAGGHEFLLAHRLFRSHRSGEVVDAKMLRFPFPPRWRYDVLRALDYFACSGARFPAGRDERLEDGIELLKNKRSPDGRWTIARGMSGKVHFNLEPVGKPSRWNTLRGLRVLRWWEQLK